jgi:C_GCAxxG_C_C family probable redox protein
MESRKFIAAEKKRCNSHNCAQAVTCTYCDLVGLPEQTALDIAGAYGTGMGNMEGTCGAIVGAGIILGLVTKDRNLSRRRMKVIMTKFQERNGSTQCKQLKGIGTSTPLRDCPDCVADASEFLESILLESLHNNE